MENRLQMRIFSDTDITDPAIIDAESFAMRRSPIFITLVITAYFANEIGTNRNKVSGRPYDILITREDPQVAPVDIYLMMEAGMNGVRLKSSHMTDSDKVKLLRKVDKASAYLSQKHAVLDWPVCTCIELKTGIVKSGIIESDDGYCMVEGPEVILTCNVNLFNKCNSGLIFVDNPNVTTEIKPGMEISIDYDEIVLISEKVRDSQSIRCSVFKPGRLGSMVTVCARGATKQTPVFSKKDAAIVTFALEYQIDVLLVNYVRRPEVVKSVKQHMNKTKTRRPFIFGGICTAEGLLNVENVIKECDGIVFSREYLAYELEYKYLNRMKQIQKWVGAKCHQAGKPFYISGGVFSNALACGVITGSERSTAANAIFEGVTGFVLVDCPRVEFVVKTIKALNNLCCTVEPFTNQRKDFWRLIMEIQMPVNAAEAAAISCALLVNQCNAKLIVLPTVTGKSAQILLRLRPSCIILTVSKDKGITRRLLTVRCVTPLLYKVEPGKRERWEEAMEARVRFAEAYAVKHGWVVYGDTYVSLQRGTEQSAFCDCVKIWTVTLSRKRNVVCEDSNEDKILHPNTSKITLASTLARPYSTGIFNKVPKKPLE